MDAEVSDEELARVADDDEDELGTFRCEAVFVYSHQTSCQSTKLTKPYQKMGY